MRRCPPRPARKRSGDGKEHSTKSGEGTQDGGGIFFPCRSLPSPTEERGRAGQRETARQPRALPCSLPPGGRGRVRGASVPHAKLRAVQLAREVLRRQAEQRPETEIHLVADEQAQAAAEARVGHPARLL